MKFSDIPGHEAAKTRMRQMADSGRIPHAILLEGPEGIGKLSLARAFAQYIHCEHPTPDGEPCGHCQPCLLHQSMNHIDTTYIYPVVKAEGSGPTPPVAADYRQEWLDYLNERIYMDTSAWIRNFSKKNPQLMTYVTESNALIHDLAFTSHVSRYKIVIWWLPEKMNIEAANKLLKLIEEPYDDTLFIMVSDNPAEILPTIYSRVQRIRLKRLPDETVARYLTENFNVSEADAMALAHIAEGNVTRAVDALHQSKETAEAFDFFVRLMRLAYQRNVHTLREWADELAALGRDREIAFYEYAIRLIRENFVYNLNVPELNYMNSGEQQFSTRFARFITADNVERLIETFEAARVDIAGNGNGKIINLDVAIKVILSLLPPKK